MYPFLYRVCQQDRNCNQILGHKNHNTVYIVLVGKIDYHYENFKWANDKVVGPLPLVPGVDIVDSYRIFNSEADAMSFIRVWWMKYEV